MPARAAASVREPHVRRHGLRHQPGHPQAVPGHRDPGGAPTRLLSAALRQLDRPALVVWGRHDPYIPVEQAERQWETFPSARVIVLDGSGHWPFVDDPEAVAGPVLAFLREVMTMLSARFTMPSEASPEAMTTVMGRSTA